MASIWSRNKIWGGTFNTDVDVSDNTNNASVVPASAYLGLKISTEVDSESRNRSKWFSSVIGQLLRAVLHKEEDRATGSNIGVSGTGTEPTEIIYTTPSQLPEVAKTTNDFSTPAKSDSNGVLTTTNDLFNVSIVTTDRKNKRFVVNFSEAGVLFFKARTWLDSELVSKINGLIATAIAAIPARIPPVTFQADIAGPVTLTGSYVSVPSATYTTPSGTSNYKISVVSQLQMNTTSTFLSVGTLRLYNSTDGITYDIRDVAIGAVASNVDSVVNAVLSTIQSIGSSKTIVLQVKNGDLHTAIASPIISKIKFLVEEIK